MRHATEGVQADPEDPATLMLREAQLLVGYRDSPIVGSPDAAADGGRPRPGDRVPDCGGLTGQIATHALRLYDVLRERDHVLLLYGTGAPDEGFEQLAGAAAESARGRVETCAVVRSTDAAADAGRLPMYRDTHGEFVRGFAAQAPTAFLVRPDGYLAARLHRPTPQTLAACLARVFRA
ncbi:hypothetical protein RKD18_007860 [Streptomyces phaeoluteigriseus]